MNRLLFREWVSSPQMPDENEYQCPHFTTCVSLNAYLIEINTVKLVSTTE